MSNDNTTWVAGLRPDAVQEGAGLSSPASNVALRPPTTDSEIRPVTLKPACLCLRHKLMYVDGRQASPGMVDDSSDTRVFFCVKSQDSLGPDNRPVHPQTCTSSRPCFKK